MTLFIADIASYQGALSLADLRAAGFAGINVKVSHGLGQRSVHEKAAQYVRDARAAGMALSCFHWLTGNASGVAQADYAYRRMAELGLNVPGVACVVDVEGRSDTEGGEPTGAVYRDFLARMRALLGRPVVTYTGDWYAEPRAWLRASPDSPWLWSAPTVGYVPAYPGDSSQMWDTGYAGWDALSIMQYRVAKIVGISVSQSAVRSASTWTAITGGIPMVSPWVLVPAGVSLRTEFNELSPNRDKGADGSIGDSAHNSSSDHTPDEDSDILRDHDGDSKNEVHAVDIDSTGPWPGPAELSQKKRFHRLNMKVIEKEKKRWLDPNDVCRLEYMIWNRQIYSRKRDFAPVPYTGSDPHTNHAHFSFRYLTTAENDTSPWGLLSEEDEVTEAELIAALNKWATSDAGKKALFEAVLYYLVPAPEGSNDADGKWRVLSYITNTYPAAVSARTYSAAGRDAAQAALVKVAEEDGDRDTILAAIQAQNAIDVQALGAAIAANLPPSTGTGETVTGEQIEAALRNVFADAASSDSSPA